MMEVCTASKQLLQSRQSSIQCLPESHHTLTDGSHLTLLACPIPPSGESNTRFSQDIAENTVIVELSFLSP